MFLLIVARVKPRGLCMTLYITMCLGCLRIYGYVLELATVSVSPLNFDGVYVLYSLPSYRTYMYCCAILCYVSPYLLTWFQFCVLCRKLVHVFAFSYVAPQFRKLPVYVSPFQCIRVYFVCPLHPLLYTRLYRSPCALVCE